MLTLLLIRHAKSSWDNPDLSDFDRALNNRGKRDAPFMGKQLLLKNDIPDYILCSSAKRTKSTIARIAKAIQFNKDAIAYHNALYHAEIPTLLQHVNALHNKHKIVYLCGHNNGITAFANYLTNGEIVNMPTCGIVKIQFSFDHWNMVSKGTGDVVYFDYPKRYPELKNNI